MEKEKAPPLPVVEEFRRTLEDCEELYRTSALDYTRAHPELPRQEALDFSARMIDLHRGLVIKTFLEIAQVDWKWSQGELLLARELFKHVWDRRLSKDQLKQSLQHFREQTQLTWDSLVGPFERLPLLRERADQLQTLVLRMANLVAKVDGDVQPEEVEQLKWIQAELERILERVPLATLVHEPTAAGVQAVRQMTAAANGIREECDLKQENAIQVKPLPPEQQLADTLAELDQLIGLPNIKQEVRSLVNFLKVQKEREKHSLPQTAITLHSVFSGNPGTGKTTVARLLGRVFGAMGILTKGHLIETDRSGLVAEYAGQTAPKTNKRIDDSLDGLLFIDEAYSLVAETGDDPYGAEAVQTLLKRMEDNRTRLVVVLAGYPEPMEGLLQSNPGLSSRFARHFHFADYSAAELGMIFHSMCQANHYELPSLTRVKLLLGFQHLLDHRDEHFGNGRLARNVFERSISRLADRIAGIAPLTRELLTTLEPVDITMDNVPETVWQDLDGKQHFFLVTCPGCQQPSRLKHQLLGQSVQCRKCQHRFKAEWGEVEEVKNDK